MAEGTKENEIPNTKTNPIATYKLFNDGIAKSRCTHNKITDPITIMLAPFPFLSYKLPKKGVKNKAPKGNNAGMNPAYSSDTPNFCTIKFVAYFIKGKTAE